MNDKIEKVFFLNSFNYFNLLEFFACLLILVAIVAITIIYDGFRKNKKLKKKDNQFIWGKNRYKRFEI